MGIGDQIFDALNRFQNGVGSVLRVIATSGIDHIRRRTLSGRSKSGHPFAGYSDGYRKRKGQSRVDLYSNSRVSKRDRHMLDDMGIIIGGGEGTFSELGGGARGRFRDAGGRFASAGSQTIGIGFTEPKSAMIASAQIRGTRTGKPRDFFGLPNSFIDESVGRSFRGLFERSFDSLGNDMIEVKLL